MITACGFMLVLFSAFWILRRPVRVLDLGLMSLMGFLLLSTTLRADVSPTAGVDPLAGLVNALGGTSLTWGSVVAFIFSAIVGLLQYAGTKNMVIAVIQASPNPLVRFAAPLLASTVIGTVGAYITQRWGVTPAQAAISAGVAWAAFEYLHGNGLSVLIKDAEGKIIQLLTKVASAPQPK